MALAAEIARIETALREVESALARAPASPKIREFRSRASTFSRGLMNFAGRVPRPEQVAALLESVLELHARVFAGEPGGAPAVRRQSVPRMQAVQTSNNVRPIQPRVSLPPPRASQRPTAPPPILHGSRPPASRSTPPGSRTAPPGARTTPPGARTVPPLRALPPMQAAMATTPPPRMMTPISLTMPPGPMTEPPPPLTTMPPPEIATVPPPSSSASRR